MKHLTNNRPKTLLSVDGLPILFHLIKKYPKSNFIIVGWYKLGVLKKYVNHFFPSKHIKFVISEGATIGNNSGISKALEMVPDNHPLMIMWSDLLHQKKINFSQLDNKQNYIGLSGNFFCRWKFHKGKLIEKRSRKFGILGVYIFYDKKLLQQIPQTGEFCEFLRRSEMIFKPLDLSRKITEIGTLRKYYKTISKKPISRSFNKIIFNENKVIKLPLNQQGKNIGATETSWYKEFSNEKWNFIPQIHEYNPLVLERVDGTHLHRLRLNRQEKKKVINKIIANIKTIHNSRPAIESDHFESNYEAYLSKTKKRLDSISTLIPYIDDDFITINHKKCLNPYLHWSEIENLIPPHFTNLYTPIHGDITFSNILFDRSTQKVSFIDPRGYFGKEKIYGDPDYDWAKLYYSLVGNYDNFNSKRFRLTISKSNINLKIVPSGFTRFKNFFYTLTKTNKTKIELLHAIIWLSLSSYVWDDYDSICGAFYKGTRLLHDFTKKTL